MHWFHKMYEVDAFYIFRQTPEQIHASKEISIPFIRSDSIDEITYNSDSPSTSKCQTLVFKNDFRCTSGHDL